jgi:hypothetical protein
MVGGMTNMCAADVEAIRAVGSRQVPLAELYGLDDRVLTRMCERALSQIDAGKIEEGLPLLEILTALKSDDPILVYVSGEVHTKIGDHGKALAAYEEAMIRAQNVGVEALVERVQRGRAASLWALGRIGEATFDLIELAQSKDTELAQEARTILNALKKKEVAP